MPKPILFLLLALTGLSTAFAQSIDNTCATCGRQSLDSANLKVNPIRVNQVGYRTDDPHKQAVVGDPKVNTFHVLRSNGTVAYQGVLENQGSFPYKGRIKITGYYSSIVKLYELKNTNNLDSADASAVEAIKVASFGPLTEEGTFRIAVGSDTSLPFQIRMTIYNDIFETSLKFFGWQRSGDNQSWAHGPSHMKDGSGRPGGASKAGSLQGGWYDCGDYFKVGQTIAYSFTNLILTYTLWPQKAEDRYGASYNDTLPFGTDGIPDLLREAKIGADYVMRLYRASEEDGLLAKNDMYQNVGVWGNDHRYWDRPENADAAPVAQGGPDRPVDRMGGSAVAGQFAGALALFSQAWEPFDPAFADSCLLAAKDIYKRVVIPNRLVPGPGTIEGYYIEQTRWDDDLAWAATTLWYATRDTAYKYDLMGNKAYGSNPLAIYNKETFPLGFLAMHASHLFSPGGWVMDYQNTHLHSLWLMFNKMYRSDSLAATWGIPAADAQDMRTRLRTTVGERYASESTNGNAVYPGTNANMLKPYNLVWSSMTWGMNRYNMGGLLPLVAYHEMIRDDSAQAAKPYWNLILDNMNYNLGQNPWDISFLVGAGSKNLQHPHNRIANPEGYNAGGIPYPYRAPKGALMGGAVPGTLLKDEWEKYDVTETCIDFSAQMVLPSQYLAQDLPPDNDGPKFSNVTVVMVSDTSALVSWTTDELSRDTLFYSLTPGGQLVGKVTANLAKTKSAQIDGLKPGTTYYFYFKGMDIYRNVSRDDNRGRYYDFTTTLGPALPPVISDVKACNIRADKATIFWWTDVPSLSAVEYAPEGQNFATAKKRVDGDDEGIPSRFHKVTLKGLKPGTSYRYDAISGAARADSNGQHHRFATSVDFANYTIQIKATTKNASGTGAHFYMRVANNESRPYVGLELRLYFQATEEVARNIVVHGTDNAIFDVTGTVRQSTTGVRSVGAAVPVPGMDGTWYFPITILDTLPVAGSLRLELKMDNANWEPIPWSAFKGAWSLSKHTSPVAFPGIDLNRPWLTPEPVETRDGVPTITYVDNPYIAAYTQGVHIYGYPPDGAKPRVYRTTDYRFEKPLPSPATSVKQDSLMLHFQGRSWSFPDVVRTDWQLDAPALRTRTPILGREDSIRYAYDGTEPEGTNVHEFAFWGDRDSVYCSCAWERYTVVVDTMKIPPRALRLVFEPAGPLTGYRGGQRLSATVKLIDSAGGVFDTTATIRLALSGTLAKAYASASSTTPVVAVSMVKGVAQIWFEEPNAAVPADTVSVEATTNVAYAVVKPGLLELRFLPQPPWPLVDSAWTVDPACTGKPTEVRLRLSSPFDANLAIRSTAASLGAGTDLLELATPTVMTDSVTLAAGIPAAWNAGPDAQGTLRLHLHVGGAGRDTVVQLTAAIRDRVGPRPLSAAVTERFAPGPDTVIVEFSEPVTASTAWPFAVTGGTAPSATTSVANLSPTYLKWVVSGSTLGAGAMLSMASPEVVEDLAGNATASCGATVPVSVRPSPLPMVSATVSDPGELGKATRLVVRFARAVRDADLPDSLVLLWGGKPVSIVATNLVRSLDSLELAADLVPPLPEGSGSLPDGSGRVVFRRGAGASGRSDTIVAADRVGPALVSALLREGPQSDTLVLKISEAVRAGAAGVSDLLRKSGVAVGAANWRVVGADSSRWTLIVPTGSILAGDSLRLTDAWKDRSANTAAAQAPWVGLQVADRPPRDAWARDANGDGRVDQVVLRFSRALACPASLKLRWPDSNGVLQEKLLSAGDARVAVSADGALWTVDLSADPFVYGKTGLEAGQELSLGSFQPGACQDATAPWEAFAVRDSVAPAVHVANLRFADPGQTLDTLHVVFTERIWITGANPSILRVKGVSPERAVVQMAIARQSPDGREVWLLFDPADPAWTAFVRGDSVRAMPGSEATLADALGNGAADPGRWAPIRFGVRQPRFSLELYPQPVLEWKGWEIPSTATPLTILVRTHGNGPWSTLDGTPVPDATRLVGPLATVNGPVKGMAKLFDNMGTFVANADLGGVYEQVLAGRIPTDAAGQYDVWLAWDGRASSTKFAASGVYTMRLVLMRDIAPEGRSPQWLVLNRLFKMGWLVR